MKYEQILETADAMAQELVKRKVDPNEVASALATLRSDPNGPRFFKFLDTVVSHGDAVVRSNRTLGYYRDLRAVCQRHLVSYRGEPKQMAQVLGWTIRLMRFYRAEGLKPQRPSRPQRSKAAPAAGGERQSGRVKFFDANKGFGFIIPDGGGKDVYVNRSQLGGGLTSLSSNQRVTYRIGQGRKGPRAEDVRLE